MWIKHPKYVATLPLKCKRLKIAQIVHKIRQSYYIKNFTHIQSVIDTKIVQDILF